MQRQWNPSRCYVIRESLYMSGGVVRLETKTRIKLDKDSRRVDESGARGEVTQTLRTRNVEKWNESRNSQVPNTLWNSTRPASRRDTCAPPWGRLHEFRKASSRGDIVVVSDRETINSTIHGTKLKCTHGQLEQLTLLRYQGFILIRW